MTGAREELVWVSPKSGRAVSRAGGGGLGGQAAWFCRLFCGTGGPAGGPADVAAALALTGYFLEARLAPTLPRQALPGARARAVEAMLRGLR